MKVLSFFMKFVFIMAALMGVAYFCNAQNPPQKVNAYYEFTGTLSDSAMGFPSRLGSASVYRVPGVAYYTASDSTHIHVWTGHNDIAIGGGGGGSQNLQQTLNIGDFKNTPYTDSLTGQPGLDTLGYHMWYGYPSNYGTAYSGGNGVMGRFSTGWQRFNNVNLPITRPNVVGIPWAYNATAGGSIENSSELAGFSFRTETSYNLNFAGSLTTEIHFPEFYANHGALTERLWSYYIDNTSGACIHQSQIQSMNWDTKNTNTPYHTFGVSTSHGDSTTSFSASYQIRDLVGQTTAATTYSYLDNDWGHLTEVYDRGSKTWTIDPAAPSWNGYTYTFNGKTVTVAGDGYGSSTLRIASTSDQPTAALVQQFANTFSNRPYHQIDKRLGNGSTIIGLGNLAGGVEWGSDQATTIEGKAHGTAGGSTIQLYDVVILQTDSNNTTHTTFTATPNGDVITRNGVVGPYMYFNPATGGTVNAIRGYNMIDPTPGAIAALTIALPTNPIDGQVVEFKFSQSVATITFTGGTVKGAGTAATQFQYTKLVWNSTGGFWL